MRHLTVLVLCCLLGMLPAAAQSESKLDQALDALVAVGCVAARIAHRIDKDEVALAIDQREGAQLEAVDHVFVHVLQRDELKIHNRVR